jgi:Ca-activated chloride channel family protein
MDGWKMDTAKRAATRLIDSLHPHARFGILAFDNYVEAFEQGMLHPASDRVRFQATQWLAHIHARGGTEMLHALQQAIQCCQQVGGAPHYDEPPRPRETAARPIIVLITDGQVGNEEQILRYVASAGVVLYVVGIDEALNDAFLRRMAEQTGGLFMAVESEDRLDETLDLLRQRLSTPVLQDLQVSSHDVPLTANTTVPKQPINLYVRGVAYVLQRWQGKVPKTATATVEGRRTDGTVWQQTIPVLRVKTPVLRTSWARHMVRLLEDLYYLAGVKRLEQRIVSLSLQYGVLSRFTAYVAVDRSEQVNQGGQTHRIVQPVETPRGWQPPRPAAPPRPSRQTYTSSLTVGFLTTEDVDKAFACLLSPSMWTSSPPPMVESESTLQLQSLYRTARTLEGESPSAVDPFLLELLMALDEWLREHSEEHPHAPRVIELVDAILEHFQARWDAARVQRLLALCRETLAALLEQPSRRERWW